MSHSERSSLFTFINSILMGRSSSAVVEHSTYYPMQGVRIQSLALGDIKWKGIVISNLNYSTKSLYNIGHLVSIVLRSKFFSTMIFIVVHRIKHYTDIFCRLRSVLAFIGGAAVFWSLMEVLLCSGVYCRCFCVLAFIGGVTVFWHLLEVLLCSGVYCRCYCVLAFIGGATVFWRLLQVLLCSGVYSQCYYVLEFVGAANLFWL